MENSRRDAILFSVVNMFLILLLILGCIHALPVKNRFTGNYRKNIVDFVKEEEFQPWSSTNYQQSNDRPAPDYKLTRSLNDFMEYFASHVNKSEHSREATVCFACKALVWFLQQGLEKNEDRVASTVNTICKALHIEPVDICDGIVKAFKDEVLTVTDELFLDPYEVCGFILGSNCAKFYDPYQMWNISLPTQRRIANASDAPHPHSQSSQLRVLHLADIHIDLKYKVGSNMECNRPLCCRNASGITTSPAAKAGQWGSYGPCDLPLQTFENLFKHLSQNDKFDYIIWTGDLISHDDWDQTRTEELNLVDYLGAMFTKYFPQTPVYWSIGNHESVPVNSFPPSYITGNDSLSWLYPHLAQTWSHWLPNSTFVNITRGGFYTVSLQPGYRLVSLNMNYCNNENWWMLLNTTDPTGELEWLVSVLYKAESVGEKVHIVGHIAPGSNDCLKAWSWNYYRIVNRFSNTITGQFFGHAHTDSLEIFYDLNEPEKPISVAYLAPSVTTFIGMNPAYRVYAIDGFYEGSTWSVLDHSTYIMNLTEANKFNRPRWTLEYNAKSAYNLTSLTPQSWNQFSVELLQNEDKMQQYYRYFFKGTPADDYCDRSCAKKYVCAMRSGRSHDDTFCHDLHLDIHAYKRWQKQHVMC